MATWLWMMLYGFLDRKALAYISRHRRQTRTAVPFEIRETTVAEKVQQLWPLLQAHRDELATARHLMEVAPNVANYKALEDAGLLLSLVAYEGERTIGYSINYLGPHAHYGGLTYAHNDVLFVAKEHRGSRLGLRLIAETERVARERGARMVMWHAKPGTALEQMMPRLGYRVQDTIFSKEV